MPYADMEACMQKPYPGAHGLKGFMLKKDQAGIVVVISILAVVFMAFLNSYEVPPEFRLAFLLASSIFILAFIKTDIALIILILSMLLSPELPVGGVSGRSVTLRMDDVFLLIVFMGWMARMAVNKEVGLLRIAPLNRPVLVYIFICLMATGLGIMLENADYRKSLLYLLKYFEYFLIFFMVSNITKDIRQVKIFLFFLILTSFIVSAYAWKLHFSGVIRVAAPFDGIVGGEANTLAGYLLLMMGVITGLIIYAGRLIYRILLSGLLCFMIPPFLFTLSRGAWLAFIPMYITLIILTGKARYILLISLAIIIVSSPVLMPESVKERVNSTFVSGKVYSVFGRRIVFEKSAAARIDTWRETMEKWYKRPLLGHGVAGAGFIDSQYARVLGETGLVGFMVFAWLMASIVRAGIRTLNFMKDDWTRGLALGFLAGFIGLLFHAFSASTFIIIRIMEPFWFLVAIIVMLPEITASSRKEERA